MPITRLKPILIARKRAALRLDGGAMDFWPDYLDSVETTQLLDYLLADGAVRWRSDEIMMFGRRVRQPRLTAWIANPGITYRYSGLTLAPEAWPDALRTLRERLARDLGAPFNSVLANLYRDGNDAMGWHRDNEPELGPAPVIASLSLGETRYFDLRHRNWRERELPVHRFELRGGDLVVMRGTTQQHWHHRVPRQKTHDGARINLSFRQTNPGRARRSRRN